MPREVQSLLINLNCTITTLLLCLVSVLFEGRIGKLVELLGITPRTSHSKANVLLLNFTSEHCNLFPNSSSLTFFLIVVMALNMMSILLK